MEDSIFYTAEQLKKSTLTDDRQVARETGILLGSMFGRGARVGAQVRTKVVESASWVGCLAFQATVTGIFFGASTLVVHSVLSEHFLPKPNAQELVLLVKDRSLRDQFLYDWLPRSAVQILVSWFTKSSTPSHTKVLQLIIAQSVVTAVLPE